MTNGKEVVCRDDIAPWNLVINDGGEMFLIDFDEAEPGEVVDDLAYALWTFLDLGSEIPVKVQTPKIRLVCEAYGFDDGKILVEAILKQQNKILQKRLDLAKNHNNKEERMFSAEAAERIKKEIQWVEENNKAIETALN